MTKKDKSDSGDPGFPVHEMCRVMPAPSPERYASIKESIRASGVLEGLIAWKDHTGKMWWIDGRTRKRAYDELIKEGAWPDDDPRRELPWWTYPDDKTEVPAEEALAYVITRNRERRHLDSGQLACVEVEGSALWNKYRTARLKRDKKGGKADEPTRSTKGDLATALAEDAGTNRSYIFDAQKLRVEAPKLYEAVRDGVLNLSAGKDILVECPDLVKKVEKGKLSPVDAAAQLMDRREQKRAKRRADKASQGSGNGHAAPAAATGNGSGSSDSGAGNGHTVAEPEPGPLLDGLGQPITDPDMLAVFSVADKANELMAILRQAKKDVKAMADEPGGARLHAQEILAALDNHVIAELRDHVPYVACQPCAGEGKVPGTRAKCPSCDGRGWLDKIQYQHTREEAGAAK